MKIEFVAGMGNPRKGMENQTHLSRAFKQPMRIHSDRGIQPALSSQETQGRYYVLVSPKSTNTPSQSINTITNHTKTMATSRLSTGIQFPTLTLLSEEARAKTSVWLEKARDSLVLGQDYSLSSSGVLKKSNLQILSGKMLKELYLAVADGTLPESKLSSPKLAMMSSGKFLTPKTSEFPKTVKESSLSDILEENPNQKYFLSPQVARRLLTTAQSGAAAKGA